MVTNKISVPEFARRMEVTRQAIREAIKTGRIRAEKFGNRYLINWETESTKYLATTRKPGLRSKMKAVLPSSEDETVNMMETIADAKVQKEIYSAKKAKLDYEKAIGSVIDADEVDKMWQHIAIQTQQAILAVVDRTYQIIAAEDDPHKVRQIMVNELKVAMTELSETLEFEEPEVEESDEDEEDDE